MQFNHILFKVYYKNGFVTIRHMVHNYNFVCLKLIAYKKTYIKSLIVKVSLR